MLDHYLVCWYEDRRISNKMDLFLHDNVKKPLPVTGGPRDVGDWVESHGTVEKN